MMKFSGNPILLVPAVWLLITIASGGEPEFKVKPATKLADGKAVITFTVSAPTDVEVAVLDARGKVVRHLAAGLLGKNAPAPFKQNSLSQSIVWDGRGDYGDKVTGAKIRVRLGAGFGTAKVLDVRGQAWRRVNRMPPSNKPAPDNFASPHKLYWATFGAIVAYSAGAYLERGTARLYGDPDTGHIFFSPLDNKEHWEDWYRLDVSKSGKERYSNVPMLPFVTGSMSFGSDGKIYLFPWGMATWRLNREWKAAPFSGIGKAGMLAPKRNSPKIDASGYGDGMGPGATCLGLDGKIYDFISHPQSGYARLTVWGRDGKLEKSGFIPFTRARHVSNILVDRQGFLYVTLNGLPEGYQPPQPYKPDFKKSFAGTIVKLRIKSRWSDKQDPQAGLVPSDAAKKSAGLVLESGQISWRVPGPWGSTMGFGSLKLLPTKKIFVADVERVIPGISWASPSDLCSCSCLRMDMDRFGRLYVPDPAFSRVRILDSNGNDLAVISKKIADLHIGWPLWVTSVGDAFAFYDGSNRRGLHIEIKFKVSETVALP
jgi:hypothetical protein